LGCVAPLAPRLLSEVVLPSLPRKSMTETKPSGYEAELADYKPCLFDAYCGEPVAWGFQILTRMGEYRFNALRKFGELECDHSGFASTWFLIVRKLTREDAVERYGEITSEEFGPRGGWKSVTFGTTTFLSKSVSSKKRK
jgi:hypothetical protein